MILVTGATGTVGSEVVRLLAARGEATRAMTRDPGRAATPPGVEVVRGDYDDAPSLKRAVEGATALFLLSAPDPAIARHDRAMIDAARAAGVGRVVKLSAIGIDAPDAWLGAWHLPGEQAAQASGMEWTVLRPSSFASNARQWAGLISAGQPVPNMTGPGGLGVIDPADVAAVAVEALTSSGHDGRTYTLTGPEALSVPEQVACLAEVLGRTIETVDVPADAARQQFLSVGWTDAAVEGALASFERVRQGREATVTDDVQRVLGRRPRSFEAWVRDHRDAFTTT